MDLRAAQEIFPCPRAEEIGTVVLSVLLEGCGLGVPQVRLHVVNRGNRPCTVSESWMGGDVANLLAANVNRASVAELLQMFKTGLQHRSASRGVRFKIVTA